MSTHNEDVILLTDSTGCSIKRKPKYVLKREDGKSHRFCSMEHLHAHLQSAFGSEKCPKISTLYRLLSDKAKLQKSKYASVHTLNIEKLVTKASKQHTAEPSEVSADNPLATGHL